MEKSGSSRQKIATVHFPPMSHLLCMTMLAMAIESPWKLTNMTLEGKDGWQIWTRVNWGE